jgi:predicted nucleic acid-binding protein
MPVTMVRETVEDLMEWKPHQPSLPTLSRAWHWCDQAQTNYWDALIIAAAEQSGCRWLLSEDFQAGRKFGTVTVVDPFASTPGEFGL